MSDTLDKLKQELLELDILIHNGYCDSVILERYRLLKQILANSKEG